MPTKKSSDDSLPKLNQELDKIIEWFESGAEDIEQAINKYERASEIIGKIDKYLKTAENRLEKIKFKFD